MKRALMLTAILLLPAGCNYNQNIPDGDGNSGRGSSGPSASTPTGVPSPSDTSGMNGKAAVPTEPQPQTVK